jgi:hypothetical protein
MGNLHKEGACLIHHFIRNIVAQGLEVMLNRDFALRGQFLYFLSALILPVLNISVSANTERTSLLITLIVLLRGWDS